MGGLPKDQTATVSIASQTIGTGTSWDGTRMDFVMDHVGESHVTIATGEGRVFQRGLVAEAWDRLSCAARGRLR